MDAKYAFDRPIEPKNSLVLLRWLIFERSRVEKFDEQLNRKERILWIFKSYCFNILPFAILLWQLVGILIISLDQPELINNFSYENIGGEDAWLFMPGLEKWLSYCKLTFDVLVVCSALSLAGSLTLGLVFGLTGGSIGGLAGGLAFGLAFGSAFGLMGGLIGGLAQGLTLGLVVGLAFGLTFSLAFSLVFGLTGDSVGGLAGGLAFGLAFGLIVGLVVGIFAGLVVGISAGLVVGISAGLAGGLTFGLVWCLVYFRLFTIPYHFIYAIYNVSFHKNSYLLDELIWYRIPQLDKKLVALVKKQPNAAKAFAEYLFAHRKYQRKLAATIWHALKAKSWYDNPFSNEDQFSLDFGEKSLKEFQPSTSWKEKSQDIREHYNNFLKQNNAHLREATFTQYLQAVKDLRELNLKESPKWHKLYFDAFRKWIKEAEEQLDVIKKEAAGRIYNPYQREALVPERHKEVFLGREVLKNKLAYIIRTSEQMPLLLIQGQRRVGKTSFLNFLTDLLGSGFKVIQLDLQSSNDFGSIKNWLEVLRTKFNDTLDIHEDKIWKASDDWLASWVELTKHFEKHTKYKSFKVVFAMDEYEAIHYYGFEGQFKQAERLLGAMRSLSQHQNQVVFLFVGAALFSELENPRWSNYFVHSRHFKVGYLSLSDTLSLINRPYPNFPVQYENGLPERIYELTQGHPYLVQLICRSLVEIADLSGANNIRFDDLDQVINEEILHRDNGAMSTFWYEFCNNETMKETVRSVIKNKSIEDKASLKKLLLHEFVIEEDGRYKLYVPLFEQWVKKFDVE